MTNQKGIKLSLCGLLALMTVAARVPTTTDWNAAANSWWAHVQYLADDKLEGRHTGSPGFQLAAQYVENQFHDEDLKPAGTTGYLQPVAFDVFRLDSAHTTWELEKDGQRTPVDLGTDALIHAYEGAGGEVDSEAVFVG